MQQLVASSLVAMKEECETVFTAKCVGGAGRVGPSQALKCKPRLTLCLCCLLCMRPSVVHRRRQGGSCEAAHPVFAAGQ